MRLELRASVIPGGRWAVGLGAGLEPGPGPGLRLIKVGAERRWEDGLLAVRGHGVLGCWGVGVLCGGWGDGGWSACVRAR